MTPELSSLLGCPGVNTHPGLELPKLVAMERTKVLWHHLLQMEVPMHGTHFLKGKSKTAMTDQPWRPSLSPSDTGQGPLRKGRWLFLSLSFLLCKAGVIIPTPRDKVNLSQNRRKQAPRCQPVLGIQSGCASFLPAGGVSLSRPAWQECIVCPACVGGPESSFQNRPP